MLLLAPLAAAAAMADASYRGAEATRVARGGGGCLAAATTLGGSYRDVARPRAAWGGAAAVGRTYGAGGAGGRANDGWAAVCLCGSA